MIWTFLEMRRVLNVFLSIKAAKKGLEVKCTRAPCSALRTRQAWYCIYIGISPDEKQMECVKDERKGSMKYD